MPPLSVKKKLAAKRARGRPSKASRREESRRRKQESESEEEEEEEQQQESDAESEEEEAKPAKKSPRQRAAERNGGDVAPKAAKKKVKGAKPRTGRATNRDALPVPPRRRLEKQPAEDESSDDEQDPETWDPDEDYEVEKIIDRAVEDGQLYYGVKWRGWSKKSATWVPIQELAEALDAVNEFEAGRHRGKFNSSEAKARQRRRKQGNVSGLSWSATRDLDENHLASWF